MESCIFCKIASGEIQATTVYDDNMVVAFRDLNPQAPLHVVVIPRKHVASLRDLTSDDEAVMGHIVRVAVQIAEAEGVADSGFRLVANAGSDAGQSVGHVHFHLLGGRRFRWPPG